MMKLNAGNSSAQSGQDSHLIAIEASNDKGIRPYFLVEAEQHCQAKGQGGHAAIALIDGFRETPVSLPSPDEVDDDSNRGK